MRSEEKSLRNKVNELEKIKKQLSEELDIKQRAIQQFKRVFFFALNFLTSLLMTCSLSNKAYRTGGKTKVAS